MPDHLSPEGVAAFDKFAVAHEQNLENLIASYRTLTPQFGDAGTQTRMVMAIREQLWQGQTSIGALVAALVAAAARLAQASS